MKHPKRGSAKESKSIQYKKKQIDWDRIIDDNIFKAWLYVFKKKK